MAETDFLSEGRKAFEDRDYGKAYGLFLKGAEAGDAECQFRTGNLIPFRQRPPTTLSAPFWLNFA